MILKNLIECENNLGLNDYYNNIEEFNINHKYENKVLFAKFVNPFLRFFETDFNDVVFQIYDKNIGETIGELNLNIDELNKKVQLKFNQNLNNEILINFQIKLDNVIDDENTYSSFLIIKNQNKISSAFLEEKMVHDGILILGKTLLKSGLKEIIGEKNKLQVKLLLAEIKI